LASGPAAYHYAWRGGPRFWSSSSGTPEGGPAYRAAYQKAVEGQQPDTGKFRVVIRAYLKSRDFDKLSPRTKADYGKLIVNIDAEFGAAPVGVFNRRGIRKIVYAWRDKMNGARSADLHKGLLATSVNSAVDRDYLDNNYLAGMSNLYKADRSEIIWTTEDVTLFIDGDPAKGIKPAPEWLTRILIVATETGMRPGDMIRVSRTHLKATPNGRRIQIKTNKRKRMVSIPLTPRMEKLINKTPSDQVMILVGAKGQPFAKSPSLGQAVQRRRDEAGLRKELRLYDARGTAVTRLFEAGANLRELAVHMGWSLPYAATMLQTYAALNPDSSNAILVKLDEAEKRGEL
jgi:integrase